MPKKPKEKTLGSYRIENSEVEARVVRFDQLVKNGIPLMFIDSILPGHQRMNYAVIGDTASENADFSPAVTAPHKFQIGMLCCPPNSGPAYHSHDYCEMFFVMSGRWRFYWGNDPEGEPEGEAILEPWDSISLPMHVWRGFENISDTPAWCFAVLDPHDVFRSKDPYWSERVVQAAAKLGFQADSSGRMVKPEDYEERKKKLKKKLEQAVQESLKARPKARVLKAKGKRQKAKAKAEKQKIARRA
jgi:quercetin dioxygenase-like cupin family protein